MIAYLARVVQNVLICKSCVLVLQSLVVKQCLHGVLKELDMGLVAGLMHVNEQTDHWNLIQPELGILSVHGQGDEGVCLGHLAPSLAWNQETWSVVCHPDGSLNELSHGQVCLQLQFEQSRTHSILDPVRLVMQSVQHVQHFDEAHDTHALRTPSCVEFLSEVQSTTIGMTQVWSQKVCVFIELSSKVAQKVRLCCLEVVGLNCVQGLREGSK